MKAARTRIVVIRMQRNGHFFERYLEVELGE